MGTAILKALIAKKIFRPSAIGVFEPDLVRGKVLKKLKVKIFTSNRELARASEVILFAVKPQQMGSVLAEVADEIGPKHLLLSIAAGLDSSYFLKRLSSEKSKRRFIRIMPNLASLIGEGAAGIYAHPDATPADRRLAFKIFSAIGRAIFVDREEDLDAVTAVSGSGPAFVYRFAEAVLAASDRLGLPRSTALPLLTQTLIGAARMLETSKTPIADMIQAVASKGGTTEAGLKVLTERNFAETVEKTIEAAADRARTLRQEIHSS